jgi:hypothetical protein
LPHDLEAPPGRDPNWDELYVAREGEVVLYRPIYSGDVFKDITLHPTRGEPKTRQVMVIQHPCAMRPDGVKLAPSILVARVSPFGELTREQWTTNGKLMPLPDLRPNVQSNQRHQAAFFDNTYHVHPDDLDLNKRIACLSEIGTYLLLQRWVYHSSRVVAPTFDIEAMNGHVYAEADLLESWCESAMDAGQSVTDAMADAAAWLDEEIDGTTRRKMLRKNGLRSWIIREANKSSKERYGPSARPMKPPASGTEPG